ncbi:MAG TPA: PP0621 family protein [Caldimonas sp.]|nr:PP0621 family protein [Caldimonas sp.]
MKLLVFLLAVLALVWLLRGSVRRMRAPAPPPPPLPQTMVACAQCGVHLPASDALPGRGGVFCGADHRAAFERAHPT